MYASDYGYAVSDECTQNLMSYSDATCTNNNWLFGIKEWMLPQHSYYSYYAFTVNSYGGVNNNHVSGNQNGVRPVLYLISSVEITGGDGTSSSPYTLGL